MQKLACTDYSKDIKQTCLMQGMGSNVNRMDVNRRTPLYYVQSAEAAKMLLISGARTDVKDRQDKGPSSSYYYIQRKMKSMICSIYSKNTDVDLFQLKSITCYVHFWMLRNVQVFANWSYTESKTTTSIMTVLSETEALIGWIIYYVILGTCQMEIHCIRLMHMMVGVR